MNINLHENDKSKAILRIGLALVFLYFGSVQVLHPDDWTGYVPEFLTGKILTANNWVMINGITELSLGIFLLIGLYTRFSALILGLHLLFITFEAGFNPVGVRDFGLAIATLTVWIHGPDKYCWDNKINNKKNAEKETNTQENTDNKVTTITTA